MDHLECKGVLGYGKTSVPDVHMWTGLSESQWLFNTCLLKRECMNEKWELEGNSDR